MAEDSGGMLAKVKEAKDAVGWGFTILDLFATAGSTVGLCYITPSVKLRWFMGAFAVFFSIIAYFACASLWKGKRKNDRLTWAGLSLVCSVLFALVTASLIDALGPNLATEYQWVENVREVLIRASLLGNVVVGVATGLTVMFLVGAITLSSPSMGKSVARGSARTVK